MEKFKIVGNYLLPPKGKGTNGAVNLDLLLDLFLTNDRKIKFRYNDINKSSLIWSLTNGDSEDIFYDVINMIASRNAVQLETL